VVAMATSLMCTVSAISAFCRPTTQTPIHNQLPSRYRSHKASLTVNSAIFVPTLVAMLQIYTQTNKEILYLNLSNNDVYGKIVWHSRCVEIARQARIASAHCNEARVTKENARKDNDSSPGLRPWYGVYPYSS